MPRIENLINPSDCSLKIVKILSLTIFCKTHSFLDIQIAKLKGHFVYKLRKKLSHIQVLS